MDGHCLMASCLWQPGLSRHCVRKGYRPDVKRVMRHTSPRSDEHFERFFKEHFGRVRAYVARRVTPSLVDDATLAAFVVAWRKFDSTPEPTLAWVLRIASFELRNGARRERKQAVVAPGWLEPVGGEIEVIDVEPLRQAFAELAETDREILRLVHWEQLSREEVAVVLGVSVNAANVRYHRAKTRLESRLALGETPTNTEVHQ